MMLAQDAMVTRTGGSSEAGKVVEPFMASNLVVLEWGRAVLQAYEKGEGGVEEEGDEEEPFECDEDNYKRISYRSLYTNLSTYPDPIIEGRRRRGSCLWLAQNGSSSPSPVYT